MAGYNKEKQIHITLTCMNKDELKNVALLDKRNPNNFINVAIEKYAEEVLRRV